MTTTVEHFEGFFFSDWLQPNQILSLMLNGRDIVTVTLRGENLGNLVWQNRINSKDCIFLNQFLLYHYQSRKKIINEIYFV